MKAILLTMVVLAQLNVPNIAENMQRQREQQQRDRYYQSEEKARWDEQNYRIRQEAEESNRRWLNNDSNQWGYDQ